uniref:Proteasome 20S subunit beta 7 n=1 Tax=Oncorhynchus tshawytscha TaxID=74940 RepID=A0A8C8HV52_ONCTS
MNINSLVTALVDILAGNICGIDGLVLGADTRATEGMIVAPLCRVLCPSCCCGAGTAADTAMTTQIISSNLELHSLSTGRLPRVATANHMLKQMLFRYQGHIGAALVLGGMDCNGPHLYSIYPHGSTDKLPYVTMGESAAASVFSDGYLTEEDAKRLVRDAIAAGIFNDLGSGSNIDLCVITNGRVDYLRPHDMANKKGCGHFQTTARFESAVTSKPLHVLRVRSLPNLYLPMTENIFSP